MNYGGLRIWHETGNIHFGFRSSNILLLIVAIFGDISCDSDSMWLKIWTQKLPTYDTSPIVNKLFRLGSLEVCCKIFWYI